MKNLWLEKNCEKIRLKNKDGKEQRHHYIRGKRVEFKKLDTEFTKVYGKILNFMKVSTCKGIEEDSFLIQKFKHLFKKEYDFSFFYSVNRNFLADILKQKNIFNEEKPEIFVKEKEIFCYDIANCYPSLFRMITNNYELYEIISKLPKEKRLKTLGAVAFKETVMKKENDFFLYEKAKFGNKYFFLFTTIVNVLNEINRHLIFRHENEILFTWCDSFFTPHDLGEVFEFNFLDEKVIFKKKNKFYFYKFRENKNSIVFFLKNQKKEKFYCFSKYFLNVF